ncbi:hypothetical protein A2U01_0036201, partial [Trifolium medium]|nr:hypothetical protein [Trifolium medium]
AAGSSSPY